MRVSWGLHTTLTQTRGGVALHATRHAAQSSGFTERRFWPSTAAARPNPPSTGEQKERSRQSRTRSTQHRHAAAACSCTFLLTFTQCEKQACVHVCACVCMRVRVCACVHVCVVYVCVRARAPVQTNHACCFTVQGAFGTCWSFAAAENLEGLNARQGNCVVEPCGCVRGPDPRTRDMLGVPPAHARSTGRHPGPHLHGARACVCVCVCVCVQSATTTTTHRPRSPPAQSAPCAPRDRPQAPEHFQPGAHRLLQKLPGESCRAGPS